MISLTGSFLCFRFAQLSWEPTVLLGKGVLMRYFLLIGFAAYISACASGIPFAATTIHNSSMSDGLWVGAFRNTVNLWCLIAALLGAFVTVFSSRQSPNRVPPTDTQHAC